MKNEIKRLKENNFENSKALLVAKASHLTTGNSVHLLYSNGSIGCPNPVGPGKSAMLKYQQNNKVVT